MNTRVCDARRSRLAPGFIAAVILCAWESPVVQAQQVYDYDQKWKYGSMGMGGMVPAGCLAPVPADEAVRFRITRSQLPQQLEQPIMINPGFMSEGSVSNPGSFTSYPDSFTSYPGSFTGYPAHHKRATARGIVTPRDDAADWLSGAGGSTYGNMGISESERARLKALQAQAARRKQEAAARARAEMFSHSTVDSGGLIRGIGELK